MNKPELSLIGNKSIFILTHEEEPQRNTFYGKHQYPLQNRLVVLYKD